VIRPEALRLRPDPQGAGEVVAISYFGHDQLVQVEVAGSHLLRARRGPRLDLERGQRVRLEVDGPVIAFADERQPVPPPGRAPQRSPTGLAQLGWSSSRRSRIIAIASGTEPSRISSSAGSAARV
jgi:hypothetical protein